TNDIGLSKNEPPPDQSNSSQRPPDPVAIAVLHDDLPDADVLYFKQAVLSRFAVDRLVEDGSGQFDQDVPRRFPSRAAPLDTDSPQAPAFHRMLHTSMFLLVDHAQPVSLGHPVELRALQNPNPRSFVAAYDVDSLFLTQDIKRLVGRPAVPAEWS